MSFLRIQPMCPGVFFATQKLKAKIGTRIAYPDFSGTLVKRMTADLIFYSSKTPFNKYSC